MTWCGPNRSCRGLAFIRKMSIRQLCLHLLFYVPLLIVTILLAFWIYLSSETVGNLISIDEAVKMEFDYIIVGGGTAGCVLANKLSAHEDTRVLLIEAGNLFGPLAMVPLLTSQQQKTKFDWQLRSTPQEHAAYGFIDQVQLLPRGKGLGGSSQLNYMLHFDGTKNDFRRWKAHGASEWNYENFRYFFDKETTPSMADIDEANCSSDDEATNGEFKRSEDWVDSCSATQKPKPQVNKFQTKLHVTPLPYDYSPLSSAFVDGSLQLARRDNRLEHYLVKYNTRKGLRHTTYHSYLRPAFDRENLKILLDTRVHRIAIDDSANADGVLVSEENLKYAPRTIRAKREILLCAGAYHTPQLLKLSGIGPSAELQRHKIRIVHDSPLVGTNLYDHLSLPLYVTVNASVSVTREKVLNVRELFNYLLHGRGVFANFGVIGYLNGGHDDHHGIGLFGVGSIDERMLNKIVNYHKEIFHQIFPFCGNSSQEGFVLLNTCNQPLSRGRVDLYSNRIADMPKIHPNYLSHNADVTCMIRSIRLAVQLMETRPFRRMNATIHWPEYKQCKNFGPAKGKRVAQNDRYLECLLRMSSVTAHHPGGTAAIGNSSSSVLDSQMRVRGVKHLRVIDASVLPTPVSGTPHTSIVAVAEYAANLILSQF